MSRPDRKASTVSYPNPSIPNDLLELYRANATRLPPLSTACADGMRAALQGIGVQPPHPMSPPPRVAKAIATATTNRQKAPRQQKLGQAR